MDRIDRSKNARLCKTRFRCAHHRPHEPFWDKNLNGCWDNGYGEKWLDLNRNGDGTKYPDMQNDAKYREGMLSDKRLELDKQEEITIEEESLGISFFGINQRFGRKFKIVRFRWLRANEV